MKGDARILEFMKSCGEGEKRPSLSHANILMSFFILCIRTIPFAIDHRIWKTGLPVRSAVLKPYAGQLVLRWVTTWESWLLIVFGKIFAGGVRKWKGSGTCGDFTNTYMCIVPGCSLSGGRKSVVKDG